MLLELFGFGRHTLGHSYTALNSYWIFSVIWKFKQLKTTKEINLIQKEKQSGKK